MTPFPVLVAVLGWLCLGLELGLRGTLDVPVGSLSAAPSYVVPLLVFICLWATPAQALWSAMGLGLALDLVTRLSTVDGALVVVPGAHAIGFLLAAQFVLAVRGLVIRRNPLTTAMVSILAAVILHIVVTSIITARHLYDPSLAWSAGSELGARMLSALMTGGSGLVLGIILMPLAPAIGAHGIHQRHYGRR